MVKVHQLTEDRKIKFAADPGIREMLDEFIAEQNIVIAPGRLTITAVVNTAIREYIERRRAEGQRAA